MLLKIHFLRRAVGTEVTGEGALASVDAVVLDEIVLVVKDPAAGGTHHVPQPGHALAARGQHFPQLVPVLQDIQRTWCE